MATAEPDARSTQPSEHYYFPVTTWTLILILHVLHYYQSSVALKRLRRPRVARRRSNHRIGNHRTTLPPDDHYHERKVPWSHVTYDTLVRKKQWYQWCSTIHSIQQYRYYDFSTTNNTGSSDRLHEDENHREHGWWSSPSSLSSSSSTSSFTTTTTATRTILARIQRVMVHVVRQGRNHIRGLVQGINRCRIQLPEYLRIIVWPPENSHDNHQASLVERLQRWYGDMTYTCYQSTSNQTHRIHSILLLFYVSYLLWSCRPLEYYYNYLYYYSSHQYQGLILVDADEVTTSHHQNNNHTNLNHTTVPVITTYTILPFAQVWMGIAITITLLELSIRYFFFQVLSCLHFLLIHVVIVQRQELREQQQRTHSSTLSMDEISRTATGAERPDIIPLFPDTDNDTDDHNNRLYVHLNTVNTSQQKLRNSHICVNMIQMISSLLMIYRCIIVNHSRNNTPSEFVSGKMISPVPFIWPTALFGTNISYATCLLLLYWMSLTPLLYTAAREEIPMVVPNTQNTTETDDPSDDTQIKKSSPQHTVYSIMYGTLVGWLWGNSYFMIPSLALSYLGQAVFLIVIIGSMISLKARYPNTILLLWLSNVGCNRHGRPLIYDPYQNRWMNDTVYCDDETQQNDGDESIGDEYCEENNDLDEIDIEVGHLDRDDFDDHEDIRSDIPNEGIHHQQEMTSLLNSVNFPSNVRSRRNAAVTHVRNDF